MTKRARSLLWALSLLGAAFAAAALPPSAHAQSSRRASAGEPLNFGRIDIIGGTNPAALLPDDTPQRIAVRLDDSSDALPLLRRFAVALTPDGGPLAAWAQATGPWKPIADREPLPPDHIAVKVLTWQAPIRAAGQSFSINGARHTTQWLLSADAAGVVAPGAWQPTLPPPAASNIPLMQALRLLAQSPVQRWRVRLLIDGLGSIPATPAFDDPILEALASDIEARWRAAFARVYLNDPQTAEELKQRLSLIIDFGNGVFAPAWPADAAATDTLLRDLLSPSPALGAPAARARKFLDQLATSAVWLIDDGGVLSDSGLRVLPTVGVANLTPRPLLATAQFDPVSTPRSCGSPPGFDPSNSPLSRNHRRDRPHRGRHRDGGGHATAAAHDGPPVAIVPSGSTLRRPIAGSFLDFVVVRPARNVRPAVVHVSLSLQAAGTGGRLPLGLACRMPRAQREARPRRRPGHNLPRPARQASLHAHDRRDRQSQPLAAVAPVARAMAAGSGAAHRGQVVLHCAHPPRRRRRSRGSAHRAHAA